MRTRAVALTACVMTTISLAGCGRSAHVAPLSNDGARQHYSRRTFTLAAGRLPSGSGFVITARRYRFRGRAYVALSASIVPGSSSITKIKQEAASGGYGSAQSNIAHPTNRFEPVGLVDCAARPAVLLYGTGAPAAAVALRAKGTTRTFQRAAIPVALGLGAGVLLYGPQTSAATLMQHGATDHLPAPPRHRSCMNGTESIAYFSMQQSTGTSGSLR